MTRRSPHPSPAWPLLALALVAAACQQAGAGSPSAAASGADAAVKVSTSTALGDRLVDAEGRTLYVFLNDSPGEQSTCGGGCAESWPAATVGAASPAAGNGVTADLGTLERADGTLQLTLDGWPMYRYAADAAPGDATGQGVGGVWFVARPDGSVAAPSADPSSGASAEASAVESGGYDPYDY